MTVRDIFLGFVATFLSVAITVVTVMFYNNNKQKNDYIETHTTDTVFLTKFDTIFVEKPQYVTKRIIDTCYVVTQSKDSVAIPIEQKYFSSKGIYDIWASGYKVKMDSVKVYPKTELIHISEVKEKSLVKKEHALYVFGGLQRLQGDIIPKVGISWKTEKEWLITAEIGLHQNNAVYGINIGKRINKK